MILLLLLIIIIIIFTNSMHAQLCILDKLSKFILNLLFKAFEKSLETSAVSTRSKGEGVSMEPKGRRDEVEAVGELLVTEKGKGPCSQLGLGGAGGRVC